MPGSRPNYGIDAPTLVLRFFLQGLGLLLLGIVAQVAARHERFDWLAILPIPCYSIAVTFIATATAMLIGSRYFKLRLRDRIIASIPWRGDEQVLDVGCGRGLMLLAAAKHLTTGRATGVDLWQTQDQSGNCRSATLANAAAESVSDKITLIDADARQLPFPDETFDVVLSSWAIHNIYDSHGRARAIQEISRVLKPNARLVIVDIQHTQEYARVMRESGLQTIRRTCPNFLFVIPTYTLTATKASASENSTSSMETRVIGRARDAKT